MDVILFVFFWFLSFFLQVLPFFRSYIANLFVLLLDLIRGQSTLHLLSLIVEFILIGLVVPSFRCLLFFLGFLIHIRILNLLLGLVRLHWWRLFLLSLLFFISGFLLLLDHLSEFVEDVTSFHIVLSLELLCVLGLVLVFVLLLILEISFSLRLLQVGFVHL